MLEPRGRLSFVRNRSCEAGERRDAVEQTAGRCRDERAHAFGDEHRRGAIPRREIERRRHEIASLIDRGDEAGGGLRGKTRRRIATRKRRGAEVGDTCKSFAHAAGEELATPDRAV